MVIWRKETKLVFKFWENEKDQLTGWSFSFLVAGPGIEPGSGGYEPPEVPLLHPAV